MYAVEFETHIENGIVQVPEKYTSLQSVEAKIIILAKETVSNTTFDPSIFLGSSHVSKVDLKQKSLMLLLLQRHGQIICLL